ncbi:MAG TPA: TonB-dependent receptor [Candidatus Angelobacter sp.]|jgi:outer membrane receptor for ferrienterochelin and colicin|nr:TonB-dependent receptor [Candidatus Angelobacter sp.]
MQVWLKLTRWLVLAVSLSAAFAQDRTGELRLNITDPAGATVQAHCEIVSQANHFLLAFETNTQGQYTVKELPFGSYKVTVEHPGFTPFAALVEVRSQVPTTFRVSLTVAPRNESITVTAADTILDTTNAGTAYTLGMLSLQNWVSTTPGREAIDVVQAQPGWLLEANGVLHPRGSEYGTQYVVDGVPVFENRSPAFAPAEEIEDVQSVRVYTSGIPAQFGRKLGGVVETVTERNPARGLHGTAILDEGSFGTRSGYFGGSYFDGRDVFALSANAAHTDRYLDPPVQQNFTNSAGLDGFRASFERDLTPNDRLRLMFSRSRVGFLVPNELVQQTARQKETRQNEESAGQISYQHVFSSTLLGSLNARVRDISAALQSNPESTPIQASQERGFRDGYIAGSLDVALPHHELKAGADAIDSSVHERFSYQITTQDTSTFDSSTPASFVFAGSGLDREQAFYLQDQMRFKNLSISAGLRFDHYSLRVDDVAWSPRLGVSWYIPKAGLVLRASYDRIFGTPAIENLLLSTSADVRTLNQNVAQLALRPSRGNYYEVGATKELFHKARYSANYFWRNIHNFGDDDTLLETGITFPTALHSASIYGAESQLMLPEWNHFSAWVNYSYMVAKSQLPVVGGLFLGEDAASLLNSSGTLRVTQDQRHTAHGQVRYQPVKKFWMAMGAGYGSGLPVELNGEEITTLISEFGQAVVDHVNMETRRVRPSFALDASAGVQLWKRESRTVMLQADVRNLTDRLNVINFANIFSGTALASPRAASLRLRFDF